MLISKNSFNFVITVILRVSNVAREIDFVKLNFVDDTVVVVVVFADDVVVVAVRKCVRLKVTKRRGRESVDLF